MYDARMLRTLAVLSFLVAGAFTQTPSVPKLRRRPISYEVVRAHEIKPLRHVVPVAGVDSYRIQLRLKLTISPVGDVIEVEPSGEGDSLRYWPELADEVRGWKFLPFEQDGKPVTAEIEEYIDLVPPERLPKIHVAAPLLRPNSKVSIALSRSGCFGTCPSYKVTLSADGIVFEGRGYVVAPGMHTAAVDAKGVSRLAKKFIAADFYSMEPRYVASVTDNATHVISISIDGQSKEVRDYVGLWVGMPAIIKELEGEVDDLAGVQRWVTGADGLVQALQAEKYDFKTFAAQQMLREAAQRGQTATVQQLLQAGVPAAPLPAPKPTAGARAVPPGAERWLTAASDHLDVLRVLMKAGVSKDNQKDKDLALSGAARAGNLESARALIAYGANPNADFSEPSVADSGPRVDRDVQGNGSVLMDAAASGNPEIVREILRHGPKLEIRNQDGRTAIFAASEPSYQDDDEARAECVRLLVNAGANVNARDKNGDTPLHKTYIKEVEEELLKLGADVNARNHEGETPIFTTYDDDAVARYLAHGADLTIRNNKGQTVVEAALDKGPQRREALRKAIQEFHQQQSAK
jgi:ankyrin repeat protein